MRAGTVEQNKQIGVLMKDFIEQAVTLYNHLDAQPVCHPISQEALAHIGQQDIPAHGRPL